MNWHAFVSAGLFTWLSFHVGVCVAVFWPVKPAPARFRVGSREELEAAFADVDAARDAWEQRSRGLFGLYASVPEWRRYGAQMRRMDRAYQARWPQ